MIDDNTPQQKHLLAQTLAVLLCTTPETTLGQLLNFCLAAEVIHKDSDKTPLDFAKQLVERPENLSKWLREVMDSSGKQSVDELIALSQMKLDDPEKFMDRLFASLNKINIKG